MGAFADAKSPADGRAGLRVDSVRRNKVRRLRDREPPRSEEAQVPNPILPAGPDRCVIVRACEFVSEKVRSCRCAVLDAPRVLNVLRRPHCCCIPHDDCAVGIAGEAEAVEGGVGAAAVDASPAANTQSSAAAAAALTCTKASLAYRHHRRRKVLSCERHRSHWCLVPYPTAASDGARGRIKKRHLRDSNALVKEFPLRKKVAESGPINGAAGRCVESRGELSVDDFVRRQRNRRRDEVNKLSF